MAMLLSFNYMTFFSSLYILNPLVWIRAYNLCSFSFLVCDDTCREVVMDPTNELLVCTISGHCFDSLLSPAEMEPEPDAVSLNFL